MENTIHYINDLEAALFKFDPTVRMKIHDAAKDSNPHADVSIQVGHESSM